MSSSSNTEKLTFPVADIISKLKNFDDAKVSPDAGVYLAAVLEYLVAEVLELSGEAAEQYNNDKIIPRHIMLAVRMDEDFSKLLRNVDFSNAGWFSLIQSRLLPSSRAKELDCTDESSYDESMDDEDDD